MKYILNKDLFNIVNICIILDILDISFLHKYLQSIY